jgi:hypothetical protein
VDQALALLAECTASQPRLCKLHGVCLIDCILNLPSMSLATLVEGLTVPGNVSYYAIEHTKSGRRS